MQTIGCITLILFLLKTGATSAIVKTNDNGFEWTNLPSSVTVKEKTYMSFNISATSKNNPNEIIIYNITSATMGNELISRQTIDPYVKINNENGVITITNKTNIFLFSNITLNVEAIISNEMYKCIIFGEIILLVEDIDDHIPTIDFVDTNVTLTKNGKNVSTIMFAVTDQDLAENTKYSVDINVPEKVKKAVGLSSNEGENQTIFAISIDKQEIDFDDKSINPFVIELQIQAVRNKEYTDSKNITVFLTREDTNSSQKVWYYGSWLLISIIFIFIV